MKRRDFIAKYVPLALAPFAGESLCASVMHPLSLKPETLKLLTFQSDRILVIINLSGGNDGLSTLIPQANLTPLSSYRPNVHPTFGGTWGGYRLNQSLGYIQGYNDGFDFLIQAGKLAAIHGVGSFQDGRSHFCSQDVFQTGSDVYNTSASGWIGKYFNNLTASYNAPNDRPLAVSVGPVPRSFVAAGFCQYYAIHPAYNGGAFRQANAACNKHLTELEIIRDSMDRANKYNDNVKDAYLAGEQQRAVSVVYSSHKSSLGNSLKTVASLIKGGLGAKIYNIDLNGFDTHNNQKSTQNELLIALSQGIKTFVDDLNTPVNNTNYGDKVLGMTYSEFGRRILSNNGGGTDHGSAGPMFLFGNGVNNPSSSSASGTSVPKNPAFASRILGVGGLFKEINSQNQVVSLSGINGATNVTKEYDFREVYKGIMEQWFGVPASVDVSQIIKDSNPSLLSADNLANVRAMIRG